MRIYKALLQDANRLYKMRSNIDCAFEVNSSRHLVRQSWIFEYEGGEGFIQMFPYQIDIPPFRDSYGTIPDLTDHFRIIEAPAVYHHAAAFYLSKSVYVAALLRSFYALYPYFKFPMIMTVQPATLKGLSFDDRLGFLPSSYDSIGYKQIPDPTHLPLARRHLRQC